jgi:hypothetical protein
MALTRRMAVAGPRSVADPLKAASSMRAFMPHRSTSILGCSSQPRPRCRKPNRLPFGKFSRILATRESPMDRSLTYREENLIEIRAKSSAIAVMSGARGPTSPFPSVRRYHAADRGAAAAARDIDRLKRPIVAIWLQPAGEVRLDDLGFSISSRSAG